MSQGIMVESCPLPFVAVLGMVGAQSYGDTATAQLLGLEVVPPCPPLC